MLKVPTSCLFRHEGGWAVFAVESGRAQLRTIDLGRRNGVEAHVVSGLVEGTQVIVHPSDALEDGAHIKGTVNAYNSERGGAGVGLTLPAACEASQDRALVNGG